MRRMYKTLVTALAVFIATLAIVRVPFRGYLTEVQLAGPRLAGFDLEQATRWVKQVDSHVAVVANPPGELAPRSQIRMTFVGPLPAPATSHLNDLAARLLCQYLPDQLSAYRRAALNELRSASLGSREAEDAARARLDELRQQQLAKMLRMAAEPLSAAAEVQRSRDAEVHSPAPAQVSQGETSIRKQLNALRLELSRLLASFTDEHPQVITIRSQIAKLEEQLATTPGADGEDAGPELSHAAGVAGAGRSGNSSDKFGGRNYVAMETGATLSLNGATETKTADESDALQELNAAQAELSRASRKRQEAEQYLSERMQEISSGATASDWTAARARVVMRLGGTPRSATLGLATLLATICGVVMFRASAESLEKKIYSTSELATTLEIPVIGNIAKRRRDVMDPWQRWKPAGVRSVTHFAEGAICIAVVACLVSVSVEPSLGQQVLADPFGALSEVVGRLTSS